jgi:hypothetical protein
MTEKETYPEYPDRIWLYGDGKKIKSSQTELSDDEINKQAETIEEGIYRMFFKTGAKWYREQLKINKP